MNETENNSNTHYIYVEKKDGCLTKGIKLGCGVIIAMHIMVFIMCVALGFCKGSSDDKESLSSPVQYFQVTNGKKEVTIHTGMPRDSVILLLGQPTEFDCTKYHDRISYRYGKYGSCETEIEFNNGKVSSVSRDDRGYIFN